jgi:glycosyltransferase involved in cell wall biosynthesis
MFGKPDGANPPSLAEQVIHELVDMSPDGDDPGASSSDCLARLPSEPFILFVGALRREKGVYVLLEAYRQLISPPPLVLLIGTLERDLPESIPPGVVVISEFPHGAMASAWDRALFGVMPSLLPEPMGTVVCEALSCGRAVIGTAHGGHPDIITDGVNGLLVPPGDTDALITAMRSLLDNPQLRRQLTRGAGRVGHRFATEKGVERFEQLYRAAVAA